MRLPERITIRLRAIVVLHFSGPRNSEPPVVSTVSRSVAGPAPSPWSRHPASQKDSWPTDPKEFAEAIGRARQAAGLSIRKLAAIVGISEATLRNIESGRHPPKPHHREWIIIALNRVGQGPSADPASSSSDAQASHSAPQNTSNKR